MATLEKLLRDAYPVAQSAEQAYTHNVHRDGKCYKKKKKRKRKKKQEVEERERKEEEAVDKGF